MSSRGIITMITAAPRGVTQKRKKYIIFMIAIYILFNSKCKTFNFGFFTSVVSLSDIGN